MKTPTISIGMPVYNGETYLSTAIQSLLQQSFEDFELIISDNASTDDTETICRSFAAIDPRVRYVRQERNQGGIWNFNEVVRLANGKYFKWAAHDDWCAETFLERCVEVLEADPGIAWCHTETMPIDASGREVTLPSDGPPSWACEAEIAADPQGNRPALGRLAARPSQRFAGVLLGRSYCLDVYGLIRRDVLMTTRLMLPFWGPEKVLISELSLRGRYHEVAEPLFFFRFHEQASSSLENTDLQQQWATSTDPSTWVFPRLQLLWSYITASWQAPIGLGGRLACQWAIVRYVMQLNKWGRVASSALSRCGIGSSGRRFLEELESQPRRTVSRPVTSEVRQGP